MSTDTTWPIEWFRDPGLTEPTPLTVDKSGRVFGHAALWNSPHMSFPGRRVTPPRSTQDYRHFHVGATTVIGDDGEETDISVGTLVMGSGHADTSLSATATAEFYDTTSTVAAAVCAGEDAIGLWVAGATMPDLDEVSRRRLRACAVSGDWRAVPGAGLELVALLAVSTPGFSIPRSRVASGAPVSLVAAGALAPPAAFGRTVDPAWEAAAPIESVTVGKLTSGTAGARVEIAADGPVRFFGADGTQTHPSPTDFADLIAARLDERKTAAELSAAHTALLSELDDTPAVVASLLNEVDDTGAVVASLLAEVDDTPQEVDALLAALDDEDVPADLGELDADDVEALGRLDRSPKKNWVEEQGGLPDYIDRIANHLHGKGMGISRSIATAIAAAKKMCSTGDLNWPGLQQVNPGSKAQACAAVAQWEAMKKAARAD